MPKKHRKSTFATTKPENRVVHHTLLSSGLRDGRDNNSNRSTSTDQKQSSVNDLIDRLRCTQVSSTNPTNTASTNISELYPRTIHPSLRNLFELPETPPPRPRTNAPTPIGGQRVRRTPGPPPPISWLRGEGQNNGDSSTKARLRNVEATAADTFGDGRGDMRRIVYCLDRLPGIVFPREHGLLDITLKSVAINWAWHVEYDGVFLAQLPSRVRVLLLSYIARYTGDDEFVRVRALLRGRDRAMVGLSPLFMKWSGDGGEEEKEKEKGKEKGRGSDWDEDGDYEEVFQSRSDDLEVSRLDLGRALGRWISFKQLANELIVPSKSKLKDTGIGVSTTSANSVSHKHISTEDIIPSSWDEDAEADEKPITTTTTSIPKKLLDTSNLRFANLRFLSLSHPNPISANWTSLIDLLSNLTFITHLSLSHWPIPTTTPNAINTKIHHPMYTSLSFSYSGTDTYSAMEDNWAEAAALLRKLSRATYCLQWLDLEGCAEWTRALCWEGVGPDGEPYGSMDQIWNGPWRNIEWIHLGIGWVPIMDIDTTNSTKEKKMDMNINMNDSRSLIHSIHAPASAPASAPPSRSSSMASRIRNIIEDDGDGDYDYDSDDDDILPWNVEVERIKYRHGKLIERFHRLVESSENVVRRILDFRKRGRGKWLYYSIS